MWSCLVTEMSTTGVKVRCWRIRRSFPEVNLWRLWLGLRKLLDGVRIVVSFAFHLWALFGKQFRKHQFQWNRSSISFTEQ